VDILRERGEIVNVYRMLRYNPLSYLFRVGALGIVLYFAIYMVIDLVFYPNLMNDFTPAGIAKQENLTGVVILLAVLLSAWFCLRARIVVREYGLEIHRLFDDVLGKYRPHTFSTWGNLIRIKIEEEDGGNDASPTYHRMLYLKHPEKCINIGAIIHIHFRRYATGRWFSKQRYTIINPDRLLISRFGQDLLKYAPQVIEAAKQETLQTEQLVRSDKVQQRA
jgi:hypothetical protein